MFNREEPYEESSGKCSGRFAYWGTIVHIKHLFLFPANPLESSIHRLCSRIHVTHVMLTNVGRRTKLLPFGKSYISCIHFSRVPVPRHELGFLMCFRSIPWVLQVSATCMLGHRLIPPAAHSCNVCALRTSAMPCHATQCHAAICYTPLCYVLRITIRHSMQRHATECYASLYHVTMLFM